MNVLNLIPRLQATPKHCPRFACIRLLSSLLRSIAVRKRQERYCSMASKFVFQISIKDFDKLMDDL
jgi:hypothetical protein